MKNKKEKGFKRCYKPLGKQPIIDLYGSASDSEKDYRTIVRHGCSSNVIGADSEWNLACGVLTERKDSFNENG